MRGVVPNVNGAGSESADVSNRRSRQVADDTDNLSGIGLRDRGGRGPPGGGCDNPEEETKPQERHAAEDTAAGRAAASG